MSFNFRVEGLVINSGRNKLADIPSSATVARNDDTPDSPLTGDPTYSDTRRMKNDLDQIDGWIYLFGSSPCTAFLPR